jgi:hypothetical protein
LRQAGEADLDEQFGTVLQQAPVWLSFDAQSMSDFVTFVKVSSEKLGDQFDLRELQSGDKLRVVTEHTKYDFAMLEGRNADLTCSRPDRPHAQVKIMGCTFGQSSSIKPNHLFCGGNLEFTYQLEGLPMTHRTTAIKAIYLCKTPTAA